MLCLAALACLLWQTLQTHPLRLWVLAAMLGLAFAIEAGFRPISGRELRL